MRGHRPQVPGLHVAECARAQSDNNNNMSMSDVRVCSTLREGVAKWELTWHHRVAAPSGSGANGLAGANDWRHKVPLILNGFESYFMNSSSTVNER